MVGGYLESQLSGHADVLSKIAILRKTFLLLLIFNLFLLKREQFRGAKYRTKE